jgi:2-keto-3-deoxy-L-arabinonate dehydratase
MLSGVVPILVTPVLEDGQLAEDELCREVDFLVERDIAAFGFGFGSEPFRFTEDERDRELEIVARHTNGRAQLIAQVLAGSTSAAIDRAGRLRELGADMLMIPAPGIVDDEQLFAHYAAIAGAVELPIVVQDAPGSGASELSVELLGRLAVEVDEVEAIKVEAAPTAPKIARVVDAVGGRATVLGGSTGLDFFNELERGSNGTMPGPSLADVFSRIWSLHRAGRREEARLVSSRLLPILTLSLRSLDTFLHVEKEILRRRGVLTSARLRAPASKADAGLFAELDLLCRDLALEMPDLAWSRDGAALTSEVQ